VKLLSNHPTSTRQVTKLSVYGSYLTTGTSLGTPCFEPPTPSPTTSCDAGQKLVPGEGCQNCTVGRVSDPDDPTRWYNFTKRRRSHLANLPIHHITTIAPYHHHRTISPPSHHPTTTLQRCVHGRNGLRRRQGGLLELQAGQSRELSTPRGARRHHCQLLSGL